MGTTKRHGLCSTKSGCALSARARARRLLVCSAAVGIAGYFAPHSAMAGTNGTWAGPVGGGLWSTPIDWATGAGIGIAEGQDAVATFSNSSGGTVHLDTNVGGIGTIGELIFDTSTWTLDNNGTATNLLTLSTSTGQPIIDVLAGTTTISANIAGTQGFDLNPGTTAAGVLVLSGTNTGLSGTVLLNRGNIDANTSSAFGSASIVINPGTVSGVDTEIEAGNNVNIPNNITMLSSQVAGGNNGTLITNNANNATFSGTITIETAATAGGQIDGSTGTSFLSFTGPIIDTAPANFVSSTNSGNGIIVRSG